MPKHIAKRIRYEVDEEFGGKWHPVGTPDQKDWVYISTDIHDDLYLGLSLKEHVGDSELPSWTTDSSDKTHMG